MVEYIEKEATVKVLRDVGTRSSGVFGVIICSIAKVIEKLPAADVRPVVHGRDVCDTVKGHCEFKCSVCGVELSSVYGGENDFGLDGGYFHFCPNCGAMMEER